jgi:hypothetical protein
MGFGEVMEIKEVEFPWRMKVTVDLVLKSKFFSGLFPSFSVCAYLPQTLATMR